MNPLPKATTENILGNMLTHKINYLSTFFLPVGLPGHEQGKQKAVVSRKREKEKKKPEPVFNYIIALVEVAA